MPTWKDELYFEYHRGVITTQAEHKRNMRDSEEQMLNAEKWASLAWLDGTEYPGDELNEDWKKVLFNQFHDLAAGSGIGVIYKDAQKDYDMVKLTAGEVADEGAGDAGGAGGHAGAGGCAGDGYKSLAWPRTDLVEMKVQLPESAAEVAVMDEKGKVMPSQVMSKDDATHEFKLLVRVSDGAVAGLQDGGVVPRRRRSSRAT